LPRIDHDKLAEKMEAAKKEGRSLSEKDMTDSLKPPTPDDIRKVRQAIEEALKPVTDVFDIEEMEADEELKKFMQNKPDNPTSDSNAPSNNKSTDASNSKN